MTIIIQTYHWIILNYNNIIIIIWYNNRLHPDPDLPLHLSLPPGPPVPAIWLSGCFPQEWWQSPGSRVLGAVWPGVCLVTCSTTDLTHVTPQVGAGHQPCGGPQGVAGVHVHTLAIASTEPTAWSELGWEHSEEAWPWLRVGGEPLEETRSLS